MLRPLIRSGAPDGVLVVTVGPGARVRPRVPSWVWAGSLVAALVLVVVAGPAGGQPMDAPSAVPNPSGPASPLPLIAPPPPPSGSSFGLEPAMPPEERRIREQEFYPGEVRSRHEPAFLPGSATAVTTGGQRMRIGFSAWTAPAVPFDIPQNGGGAAFGFTIRWDEPAPPPPAPEPATGR
jgi:hypothetical protein